MEDTDTMDDLIRFDNSNRNTINKLRYIFKKHGYVWADGKDLGFDHLVFEEKKVNLIINPKTKKVYCSPEHNLKSYKEYFHNIEVIDYNPPW